MTDLEKRVEVVSPQHPKVATVLLLDISGSMTENNKIGQLNSGLKFFKDDVMKDELAAKRIDLAVVTFGGEVKVMHDFSSIENFDPPTLSSYADTPMGAAIFKAVELVEERKKYYKSKGINYYRPWIFMITDGEPTDMKEGSEIWNRVVKEVKDGEENKKFLFFAVGVEPANMEILKKIASPNRAPVRLMQGQFRKMFEWLSKSQSKVSASKIGEKIKLESPEKAGWGDINV